MSNDATPAEQADKPILALIQRLKDGSLSPGVITKEQRLQCVEVLVLEGYAPSQIAQVVDRSEKTVRRDLAELRIKNAQAPSPELAKQLIGNFFMKWETHHATLMRLARSKEGSIADRAQAELAAWRVMKEGVELCQSLGYLPQRPQQVVGDMVYHLNIEEGERSLEDVGLVLQEITAIGQETNTLTADVTQRLQRLRLRLEELKLSQEAQQLLTQQHQAIQTQEIPNDQHPQS